MNQLLGDILLFPAQQVVNGLLRSDPYFIDSLAKFKGKALGVRCTTPPLEMLVVFDHGSIKLISGDGSSVGLSADATVKGNAVSLLSMLLREDGQTNAKGVEVSGDAEFLLDLQRCITSLDIRWDDYLAPILGDVLTASLTEAGDDLSQWSKQSRENIRRNVQDYLHEEARLVTGRQQADRFSRELAQLKLSIDRAEARMDRIRSRITVE